MGCLGVIGALILIFLVVYLLENPALLLVITAGIVLFVIINKHIKKTDEKNHIKKIRGLIDKEGKINLNEFWKVKINNNAKLKELIKIGIEKKLFYGQIQDDKNIKTRVPEKGPEGPIFTDKVSEEFKIYKNNTLVFIDNYAEKNDMEGYNFVDIKRTTIENLSSGRYLYKFDDNDNLLLLRAPLDFYYNSPSFNSDYLEDLVKINVNNIKDFQYFGTQVNENKINLKNKPPSYGIILSETLLGPSYTMLKHISETSINSTNTINDARIVQVILKDKSDIEFAGITIYYEFNRRFGNVKNKEDINKTKLSPQMNKSIDKKSDYIKELKELKELMDSGILTKKEFEQRKRRILEEN